MDRPRALAKKPSKGKGHAPPGQFFALGTKSGPEQSSKPPGPPIVPRKPNPSSLSVPQKREAPSAPGASLLAKKPKLLGQTYTALGRTGDPERARSSPTTTHKYLFEEIAEDVEPHELCDAVIDAVEKEDEERVIALLCGAVKPLKTHRAKPDQAVYLSIMYLAKARPSLFGSDNVLEAFASLLKRDVAMNFRAKGNHLVSVLACNILMTAFQDEENWPEQFIKVYLDDSLGERVWVDRSECKAFVDNIQSAFNTKFPKSSTVSDITPTGTSSAGASPAQTVQFEDEDSNSSVDPFKKEGGPSFEEDMSSVIFPRYTYQHVSIETQVLDLLREHLGRRQPIDGGSRNLLRLMTAAAGYTEVRTLAGQRLEMWLQNPKLTRVAQDLLMSVCLNCDQHSHQDIEVMSQLSRIRLKTKNLINHYLLCIRELLTQHPENLKTLMTHTIYNELSTSRNPNNMSLLSVMFNQNPETSAKILAEIFQDLLTNREDYLRALRALMREIIRAVRGDLIYTELARGLMSERQDLKYKDMDQVIKDRMFYGITDLIILTALISVTSSVKEAASAVARGDQKDMEVLRSFQETIAMIQRDAVYWLHTVAPTAFDVKATEYIHSIRKVLFVEKAEHYYKIDNWPPENERNTTLRLVSEVPVYEDTIMRVLVMGLNKGLHISAADAVDLADQLIRRAAVLYTDEHPVLQVERLDLIDALLNLCAYKHPDNITLPKGYQPPTLAIPNLYWKAWSMLLVISAFNPSTFGMAAWENYPMLRCFMEMTMTNNFKFPPPTMAVDDKAAEEINAREKQIREQEKQVILEFEGHLASCQITETNSLLMAQLTLMDPNGPARKPPTSVLEQLKMLNQNLRIGPLLCRSRTPDFLLDIIQRQGASQSMPWLAELVESSEGSLDVLPVQCLCEFLLHDSPTEGSSKDYDDDDDKGERQKKLQKQRKQEQLLARLQKLLHSETSDSRTISEVLNYFLKRLSSTQLSSRHLAVKGLSMVLARNHLEEEEDSPMEVEVSPAVEVVPSHRWLLEHLPSLPQFQAIKQTTCVTLRQACQIETNAASVSAYIIFLSKFSNNMPLQELDELALDMAQLIVERATLINHLLPAEGNSSKRADLVLASMTDLFYNYLTMAQQPQEEAYSWSNTQDQVLLHWESGKSATMNILVVHAMIILLTYGRPQGESQFDAMLDTWFPSSGTPPSAYLVDTSEEALLLPDWLKLRMIRSSVDSLVDAALIDLEPQQLLLFVQSFGIPVASMSKLLRCLDQAVDMDSYTMEQVVVDKSYMAQLVEVQHMRGATGGYGFHGMLVEQAGQEKANDKVDDVEMKPAPRSHRTQSTLSRTSQLPPAQCKDASSMKEFLIRLFADNLKVEAKERQQMFRSLQKSLAKEDIAGVVTQAFLQVLSTGSGNSVVAGLKKNLHLSCPLLRLLLALQGKSDKSLYKLFTSLYKKLEDSKSALAAIVNGYLEKARNITHADLVEDTYVAISEGKPQKDKLHAVVTDIEAASTPRAESLVTMCIAENLNSTTATERVQACAELLLPDEYGRVLPKSTAGLLVDWLALLDPEIISACPELQQKLLFAKEQLKEPKADDMDTGGREAQAHNEANSQNEAGRPVSSQSYLLALLTHQGSWSSIHRCITLLLSKNEQSEIMSGTAVLDFLWACLHIPTIWQGRDKKLPKNHVPEDVLELTPAQVCIVVNYILMEGQDVALKSSDHRAGSVSDQAQRAMIYRIPLLLRCCCNKTHLVKALMAWLTGNIRHQRANRVESQWLLLEVYINMPYKAGLGELDSDTPLLENVQTKHRSTSQLDALTHRVITGLSFTGHGAVSENKMYDANIACRKLAAEHPLLLLRQLPLISAMLQGRAQFTFGEMRHRNHILLYTHVLGILELLQPFIYHPEYTSAFTGTIKAYFELIMEHCMSNRQLGSIIVKFIKLINNYLSHDAKRACTALHPYVHILNELTGLYPELAVLRSLLAGLTLPRQEASELSDDKEESSSTEEETIPLHRPRPTSPWSLSHVASHLNRIAKGAPKEEILEVLRDLDETSKRKVDILEHFMGDLRRLMLDRSEVVRSSAHSLVMRYIRYNPSCSSDFVGTFIQCLDSNNQDIMLSALKNLAEFCLLAQEHATKLLLKTFMVGVSSKVNCETHISEAIQLLNMDTLNA